MLKFVTPNWPAPTWVKAVSTTRLGGVSQPPFDSFNMGISVNDSPQFVNNNRSQLLQTLNLKHPPIWLQQTHSDAVICYEKTDTNQADGCWSQQPHHPCLVLTADCLPLLLTNTQGTLVAALHCGWKGIYAGIIQRGVKQLQTHCDDEILAWLGPAIGPSAFEVGNEVYQQFVRQNPLDQNAFTPHQHKWLADIYQLAKNRLHALGVNNIYGGEHCTYTNKNDFYSYRRDGQTGRMASLIWLEK